MSNNVFLDHIQKLTQNLKSLSTEHDHPSVVEVTFNYIKLKRNRKITKLVEVSCYHMRSL